MNSLFSLQAGLAGFFLWALLPVPRTAPEPAPPSPPTLSAAAAGVVTPISSLPYLIQTAGNYCVTKDLLGVAGSNGITIEAPGVELDLGGYSLLGVPDSLTGIYSDGYTGVTIKNGRLFSWGENGIETGQNTTLSDVTVWRSAGAGVLLGETAFVDHVRSFENEGEGIVLGTGSIIENAIVRALSTSPVGLSVDMRCIVSSVTVERGIVGIRAGEYSQIQSCNVYMAQSVGLEAARGTYVGHSTVHGGLGDGISLSTECVARLNICSQNDGNGITALSSRNRIEENTLDANQVGLRIVGFHNLSIRNRAAGNSAQDFVLPIGNTSGPEIRDSWYIEGSRPQANFATPFF